MPMCECLEINLQKIDRQIVPSPEYYCILLKRNHGLALELDLFITWGHKYWHIKSDICKMDGHLLRHPKSI